MEQGLVELRVRGVALDGPEGIPLVVLEDKPRRLRVALPASPFEASAIIMELEGITPPRPLTHDLLAELFQDGGLALDGVFLFADESEAFRPGSIAARARLDYHKGAKRLAREARPADAIALAIRLGAPIAAQQRLLEPPAFAPRPRGGSAARSEEEGASRRKPRILIFDDWRERAVGA